MSDATAADVLIVSDLRAYYDQSQALHGVDLRIRRGELVTLLGRNGEGKTTTLRAIMGLIRRTGSVRHEGEEIGGCRPYVIARRGIGYVPEERGIFSSLTVAENLLLPPVVGPGGMTIDEIHDLFPNLRQRARSQGTKLSGGEQQMLAMARVLRTGATLLILDEVTEGLAPVIIERMAEVIQILKSRGLTILLVEQDFRFAESVADRHYVMQHGRIVDHVTAAELHDPAVAARLTARLGV